MIVFFKYILLVFLFSYPILYIVYKWDVPNISGQKDFYHYQRMMESPLDFTVAQAPWVHRQIPTLVAFAIKKCQVFYSTKISYSYFKGFKGENTQINFFSLILSNYIAYLLSIGLLLKCLIPERKNPILSFYIVAFSIGYFMVFINVIAPTAQAYAWLSCALMIYGILKKNKYFIILSLAIAMFSRETLLIFYTLYFGFEVVVGYIQNKLIKKEKLFLFFSSAISFLLILFLRTNYATGHEEQLSLDYLSETSDKIENINDFFFQVILSQGLLIFLLVTLFQNSRKHFTALLFSYIIILTITILTGIGNNSGRIIGESYLFVLFLSIIKTPTFESILPSKLKTIQI